VARIFRTRGLQTLLRARPHLRLRRLRLRRLRLRRLQKELQKELRPLLEQQTSYYLE
jgi:hypothetical protein